MNHIRVYAKHMAASFYNTDVDNVLGAGTFLMDSMGEFYEFYKSVEFIYLPVNDE